VSTAPRPRSVSPRFSPLVGAVHGAAAGLVYWIAAQIWPASIAVVLALVTSLWLSNRSRDTPTPPDDPSGRLKAAGASAPAQVLGVLLKYAALMALTSVKLPYALPPNVSLGFVLVAGHAVSRALAVSVLAAPMRRSGRPVAAADLAAALAFGAAPAALIGIPGLTGIAAALTARIACGAHVWRAGLRTSSRPALEAEPIRQLTEVVFYLGALAARAYV